MKRKITRMVVGPLSTNCYIVPLKTEDSIDASCILVDPGGDAPQIIARLEGLRLRPALILLTHGHFDHLLGLSDLVDYYKKRDHRIPIAIHSAEADRTGPKADTLHRGDFARIGALDFFNTYWTAVPAATQLLHDGDDVYSFKVLHLPGHSPGSIGLYSAEEGVLLSGDTLFRSGVGRTDLPGGNPLDLQNSLERLLTLPKETEVLPGHGEASTIGREIKFL